MAKHFDNKRDLLEEMKKTKRMNDHLSAVVFKGYMLIACMTLHEDMHFDEDGIQTFVNGIYDKLEKKTRGELSVNSMERELYEKLGVYIENPQF